MMSAIIEVQNLEREYLVIQGLFRRSTKVVKALNGISFQVGRGEVFGLLGPNGAGKTTTVKVMSTLLAPTRGTVTVMGYDVFTQPERVRQSINLISGGERNVYWRLTARENLRYFADLYKVPRAEQRRLVPEFLNLVGLSDWADQRVETFSKGMKQRLQIARGLLNNPEILFLDEPSLGLDPASAQDLRRLILRLRDEGKTIILTTHYMLEADLLCDRVAIVNKGKIVAQDKPDRLKRFAAGLSVVEVTTTGLTPDQLKQIRDHPAVLSFATRVQDQRQVIQLGTEDPHHVLARVTTEVPKEALLETHVRQATLEDAYLRLVGQT